MEKKNLLEITGEQTGLATALLLYEYAYLKSSYMRNKNAVMDLTGLVVNDELVRERTHLAEQDPSAFSITAWNECNCNNYEYNYDNRIKVDSSEIIKRISSEKSFYYFVGYKFELRYDENATQRMALIATESVESTVTTDSVDGGRLYSSNSGKRFVCFVQSAKFNRQEFGYDLILHDGTIVFLGQHGLPRWDGDEMLDVKFWRKGLMER